MKREPTKVEHNSRMRIIELITDHCYGSQNEFAKKVGIGKSSVSQYVNGKNYPSNVRAGEIARAFNVNPMWVMGFDVPKELPKEDEDFVMHQFKKDTDSFYIPIMKRMEELNTEGLDRLLDYVDLLADNEKYTKKGSDTNVDTESRQP